MSTHPIEHVPPIRHGRAKSDMQHGSQPEPTGCVLESVRTGLLLRAGNTHPPTAPKVCCLHPSPPRTSYNRPKSSAHTYTLSRACTTKVHHQLFYDLPKSITQVHLRAEARKSKSRDPTIRTLRAMHPCPPRQHNTGTYTVEPRRHRTSPPSTHSHSEALQVTRLQHTDTRTVRHAPPRREVPALQVARLHQADTRATRHANPSRKEIRGQIGAAPG